jgi:hypothetical protein
MPLQELAVRTAATAQADCHLLLASAQDHRQRLANRYPNALNWQHFYCSWNVFKAPFARTVAALISSEKKIRHPVFQSSWFQAARKICVSPLSTCEFSCPCSESTLGRRQQLKHRMPVQAQLVIEHHQFWERFSL